MNRFSLLAAIAFLISSCQKETQETLTSDSEVVEDYTQYVDQYIGTGFHGHVFLGANVPFGAVQLGPTNLTEGWDWCSGYHYSDTTVIGFAHTHLSGTGIGDLGDILLMPTRGDINLNRGSIKDSTQEDGYVAFYHHEDETIKPGYYSVWLDKYDVKAELTATARAGMQHYKYEKEGPYNVIIDLERGIGWDLPTKTYVEQVDEKTIKGYRYSKGWAVDQKIYFYMQFSAPISKIVAEKRGNLEENTSIEGERVKAAFVFNELPEGEVTVKTGISAVSIENAKENLESEMPNWDFTEIAAAADHAWNKELSKVKVKLPTEDQMKVFYTSLYHTMVAPSIFSDVNGEYRGADAKTYKDTTFTNYTTYSLWDTYRAAHPLFTLTQKDKVEDFVKSFLKIYEQQGKLPIWHLVGNETNCMVGYPGIPVVADAYFKGFDVDGELALEAMKASSTRDDFGMKFIKERGYIPADSVKESVAKALEYCLADRSIAQLAKALGKDEDYEYYNKRAHAYERYFDKKTGFMRAVMADGSFRTPFSPFKSTHMWGDYTEGNGWQYTWLVPHDVEGLIKLFGSEEAFEQKLDSLFVVEGDLGDEASPDISGLIGQYAHGNEPSHHVTYLYNYVGKPWKTADKVRYIMDSLYTTKPDGICGNEDVGQMSAWYIMSALGFYQVSPSNGQLILGSPLIEEATLDMDGTILHIEVKNNSTENKYIQKVSLNGKVYLNSFIAYSDLAKGGELLIEMGSTPSSDWGVAPENRPVSIPAQFQ
ncbi:GH92 family glycosyl hydrolase [Fulvivirga sediminis]|uniref:GH92 family glycosyl hydrolase n=1 Tax=Fulvivirga sediminis TaxID=2803949 RepID=A0A937F7R9_9BACT|nr:GH92 family glycosyl hydrolase [Fulvivirga sediminis]MBL3655875.1 GH92 family glycosyl hydrolase [Fulvivirga sediminis]